MEQCHDCGSTDDVQHGRCGPCRRTHEGHAEHRPEEGREPDLEPARNQPWIPRSAFTGRTRRNPRK